MKSIKKKAFELFPEMQTDSDDWDVIEEQCDRDDQRKAFVLGADYVLEQIESACMNGVYAKDKYRNVLNVLEQLKK